MRLSFLLLLVVAFYTACKPKTPASGVKESREVAGAPGPVYFFPTDVTKSSLEKEIKDYSAAVGTCLNLPKDQRDTGQQKWVEARGKLCDGPVFFAGDNMKAIAELTEDRLKSLRQEFCKLVKKNQIDPRFEGGKCWQYGNCGEGSWVAYCLADAAGYRKIRRCKTMNDHVFTIALDEEKDEICLLDRWNVEPSIGHYRCSSKLAIKEGSLILPDTGLPSKNNWYKGLECVDPLILDEIRLGDDQNNVQNFDAQRWEKFPFPKKVPPPEPAIEDHQKKK